jgi:hypothetical protein
VSVKRKWKLVVASSDAAHLCRIRVHSLRSGQSHLAGRRRAGDFRNERPIERCIPASDDVRIVPRRYRVWPLMFPIIDPMIPLERQTWMRREDWAEANLQADRLAE